MESHGATARVYSTYLSLERAVDTPQPQYFETEAHALFREVQPAAHGSARVTAPIEAYPSLPDGEYVAVVVMVVAAASMLLDGVFGEACR